MNNMNMNNMNNMNNNMNINNSNFQNQNQASQAIKCLQIKFLYMGDPRFPQGSPLLVQGRSNMTIQSLIKNFRIKLADDSIMIRSYVLNGNINLDMNSQLTVDQMGINEQSVITATKA